MSSSDVGQGSADFFIKGQVVNILGFCWLKGILKDKHVKTIFSSHTLKKKAVSPDLALRL